jgi:hypothetical protein
MDLYTYPFWRSCLAGQVITMEKLNALKIGRVYAWPGKASRSALCLGVHAWRSVGQQGRFIDELWCIQIDESGFL